MAKAKKKTSTPLKTSSLAISGLIIGIIALLLSALPIINNFAFVLGVLALIFSIIALIKVRQGRVTGKGMGISGVVISVLSLVIVLASQAMYSAALTSAANKLNDVADRASGAQTNNLLKNEVGVTLGQFSSTTDQYGLNATALPVTVTNKDAEQESYTVQIEAVDASGNRITDDTVIVNDLGAKQSQEEDAFKYIDQSQVDAIKTAKFNIVKVTQM